MQEYKIEQAKCSMQGLGTNTVHSVSVYTLESLKVKLYWVGLVLYFALTYCMYHKMNLESY